MTKTDYIRICQATLLDKNQECLNRLQFSEDARTDVLTPKHRLLSGEHGTTYECNMCKGTHKFADASFAYQKDLFWDKKSYPHGPNTMFTPRGEDEFKIKITSRDPRFKILEAPQ